jgi:hypothetical protein
VSPSLLSCKSASLWDRNPASLSGCGSTDGRVFLAANNADTHTTSTQARASRICFACRAIQAETTFVTTGENSAEYDLQGGVPYIIIPCTYGPGRVGRFTLALTSPADFDLVEL